MAFLGVTLETIATISAIKNADFIELASLVNTKGVFVVKKDRFNIGDKVLFFHLGAVLPEWILKELKLVGRLGGRCNNVVRRVCMRGQVSHGILGRMSLLASPFINSLRSPDTYKPIELAAKMGVMKYEPPNLLYPSGVSKYDIKDAEKHKNIVMGNVNANVEVTEKINGLNFVIVYSAIKRKIYINQGNHIVNPKKKIFNIFWAAAVKQGIIAFLNSIKGPFSKDVVIYTEMIGPLIRHNVYNVDANKVMIFDIKINGNWVIPGKRQLLVKSFFGGLENHVPILAARAKIGAWLSGSSLSISAHGRSKIGDVLREGIVIKGPDILCGIGSGGRLIFKQRDPICFLREV